MAEVSKSTGAILYLDNPLKKLYLSESSHINEKQQEPIKLLNEEVGMLQENFKVLIMNWTLNI